MDYYKLNDYDFAQIDENRGNKTLHTDKMTLAVWKLKKGVYFPDHSHPHEQLTYVAEGEIEFKAGGRSILAKKGDVVVFKGDEVHGEQPLEDVVLFNFFAPSREDFKESLPTIKPEDI